MFQVVFAATAATLGGNVRVGLEDSLYIGRGELAESNAQQVSKIRTIVEELGLTPVLALLGGVVSEPPGSAMAQLEGVLEGL